MTNFEKAVLESAKQVMADEDNGLATIICNGFNLPCSLCAIKSKCDTMDRDTIDEWLRQEVSE